MKDITPHHLRCAIGASCPAIFDVTPGHLKCGDASPMCSSVSAIEDGRELLIIGKVPSAEMMAQIEGRVGPGELAIVISAAYFTELGEK